MGSGYNVLVWDLSNSTRGVLTLSAHTDAVTSTAFSPTGLQLASGSDDGTVRVWSLPSFRQVSRATASPTSISRRWSRA